MADALAELNKNRQAGPFDPDGDGAGARITGDDDLPGVRSVEGCHAGATPDVEEHVEPRLELDRSDGADVSGKPPALCAMRCQSSSKPRRS